MAEPTTPAPPGRAPGGAGPGMTPGVTTGVTTAASTLLRGGRVVDPGSGTDAVTDVLLCGDTVAAVGPGAAAHADPGTRVLDVAGCVVGPGFVDLHSHAHGLAGQRLAAFDGVTTAVDLEAGLMPVAQAYARAADHGLPLHYGYAASWAAARATVLCGVPPVPDVTASLAALGHPQFGRDSTTAELDRWLGMLDAELGAGALGIGVLQGYAPRTDPAEFTAVARVAARHGLAVYCHVRELVEADPDTPVDGSVELVRAAAETGAAMHHCHVNSTSRRHVDRVLTLLAGARAAGSAVSVEAYPYGAGSTAVGAAFLAPDRLPVWGLTPASIVLLPSGERVADARRLAQVRADAPGTACIVEFLDEAVPADAALLRRALLADDTVVASDAMPVLWADGRTDSDAWPLPAGASTHPRTAGTFAKALRLMVRQGGGWDWPEAFRRCSWLPARVLDPTGAAAGKGHLGIGADADVVVLDPLAVTDTATYATPASPSAGVRHLFVAGTPVIVDGALRPQARPGRPVRRAG